MPDTPGQDHSTDDGGQPPLLEDILGIVPRLIDRTSAQFQFSQTLLSMLPCTRNLVTRQRIDDGEVPRHEARQPTDVLTLLEDDPGPDPAVQHDPLRPESEPPTAEGAASNGSAGAGEAVPAAEDLAIPEYDSLAASQVVPRLKTLAPEELEAIGAYETANRARRTILNRVTALLSG